MNGTRTLLLNWGRGVFWGRISHTPAVTPFTQSRNFSNRFLTEKLPRTVSNVINKSNITKNVLDKVKRISTSPTLNLQEKISAMQIKKRPSRKKRIEEIEKVENGYMNVMAFATAEEYDLEKLLAGIIQQNLYEPKKFFSSENCDTKPDVLHVTAKYKVGEEAREVYFFREGTVVIWNCTDLEGSNILSFLKSYENDFYDEATVLEESESMTYNYVKQGSHPYLKNSSFYVTKSEDSDLEKYTYSNALSLSVKLGIWEASLDRYIDSMGFITEDMKNGQKIKISRAEMLRKTGELFALRHLINLSSDLLDTPDFYWDREQLEKLYSQTCSYFSITRRTKVMNEKLNHCVELADLITSNLNDDHHVRLEWMIIILIMVEVGFEVIHYVDRFMG